MILKLPQIVTLILAVQVICQLGNRLLVLSIELTDKHLRNGHEFLFALIRRQQFVLGLVAGTAVLLLFTFGFVLVTAGTKSHRYCCQHSDSHKENLFHIFF